MSTTPKSLTDQIMISIYVRRDKHENGMTLEEYANAVAAGTQPVLDQDQYVYQFGSIQDEIELVKEWAILNSLTIVEAGAGIATVKVEGSVEIFNTLFKIELQTVVDNDRTYFTHTGEITIPSEINDVVDAVLGLDNSQQLVHNAILDPNFTPEGDLQSNTLISAPNPTDLSKAYQYPRTPGTDQKQGYGAVVGIIELGGGWTTQNLTSTFSRIGLSNPTVVDVNVSGGTNNPSTYDPNGASGEVMLDIYCVGATVPSAKQILYWAPNSFQGFVDVIGAAVVDSTNRPSVLSISWGTYESTFGGYRSLMEANLASCVAVGMTVTVAAGDYGVKAVSGGTDFTLSYPGSSSYVVCAGGTKVTINTDYTINTERAWGGSLDGGYAGGGGLSQYFSIPSWQSGQGFQSKLYSTGVSTDLAVRGTPDFSAMATGYQFYWYDYRNSSNPVPNQFSSFVGTSAVAPLLAGLIAAINLLTGTRIGFINATWYAARATAFNDITTGSNTLSSGTVGYSASVGWDACTGLGSPIGTQLYKLHKLGNCFPKINYGFRPTTGQTYPRITSGVR